MANQDWINLGDEIRDIVENAIDSQNFHKLNQSISDTVNSAMENVNRTIRGAGAAGQRIQDEFTGQQGRNSYRGNANYIRPRDIVKNTPALFAKTGPSTCAGYALAITGGILTGGLGIAVLILLIIAIATGSMGAPFSIPIFIMLPLLLGSGFMAWKGSSILGRLKRFKNYIRGLRGKNYCGIRELAQLVGKSENYVIKDLKNMIERGMFLEGHLDRQQTCLITSNEVYEQYQLAQKQLEIRQKEIQQEADRPESRLSEETRNVIKEGNDYLKAIKDSNDAIPGVEISKKISRLEVVIQKIFQRVEQHPELIPDLRKFMDYYLPTTLKLLKAYEEMDAQPVQGENIATAKKEIENTLDTINTAFENLLDSFFKDTAWDISTDISVLQTMLAQEGLTKKDF